MALDFRSFVLTFLEHNMVDEGIDEINNRTLMDEILHQTPSFQLFY
jgi:hypothetical protein